MMGDKIVKNEIQIKSKFELNPALGYTVQTTHTYTYRTCVASQQQREGLTRTTSLFQRNVGRVTSIVTYSHSTDLRPLFSNLLLSLLICYDGRARTPTSTRCWTSSQYCTRVEYWQSQLFEIFVGMATVPSSACTPWFRSGSTHLPTDSSNTIECLRQLTLLNLWLLWSSPWITTFVLCTGLVHRIAFPHVCLCFTVNGVLSLEILLFKCFIFDRRIDSFPVCWALF